MQAQFLGDRERLGGRKALLALTPEAPFGLFDEPPVPAGEGLDVIAVHVAILPPGAHLPVVGNELDDVAALQGAALPECTAAWLFCQRSIVSAEGRKSMASPVSSSDFRLDSSIGQPP